MPDTRELSAVGGPLWYARVLPLIFLCVGGGLALPALVMLAANLSLHVFGAAAVATAVEIVQEPDSDGSGYVSCPKFTFHAANGKELLWQSHSCSNPSAWAQGERVRVFYYPSHPSYNVVDTFAQEWLRPLTFGLFAVCVLPFGVLPLAIRRRRAKLRQRLDGCCQCIDTEFAGIGRNTLVSVGDEHPYRVLSRWTDPRSGRQYEFHSIDLWMDPSAWLPRGGIPVRIDPENPKRYEMEIPFIPAEVREGFGSQPSADSANDISIR